MKSDGRPPGLTVGALRKSLQGLPEDMVVVVRAKSDSIDFHGGIVGAATCAVGFVVMIIDEHRSKNRRSELLIELGLLAKTDKNFKDDLRKMIAPEPPSS